MTFHWSECAAPCSMGQSETLYLAPAFVLQLYASIRHAAVAMVEGCGRPHAAV